MSDIENNPIYVKFQQWLEDNIAADGQGKRKVTGAQLRLFLNGNVFNDASTVAVAGARVSLLWSYLIGPDQRAWDYGDSALFIAALPARC